MSTNELIELVKEYDLICDHLRILRFQSREFVSAATNGHGVGIAARLERKLKEAETTLRME